MSLFGKAKIEWFQEIKLFIGDKNVKTSFFIPKIKDNINKICTKYKPDDKFEYICNDNNVYN